MKRIFFLLLFLIVTNTAISRNSPHCTMNATVTGVKDGDVIKVDDGINNNETIKLRDIVIIKPVLAKSTLNISILDKKICLECSGSDNLGRLLCDVYEIVPKNSILQEPINSILVDYGFARFKNESPDNNIGSSDFLDNPHELEESSQPEPGEYSRNPPVASMPHVIRKSDVPVVTSNSSPSMG